MKVRVSLLVLFLLLGWAISEAKTTAEYLKEAKGLERKGEIEKAIEVMREAVASDSGDATAWAYLGLYLGQSAGGSRDMMFQAARTSQSFEALDRSLSLDSLNVYGLLYRGLMGVVVPSFLGRLDQGIKDLERLVHPPGDMVSEDLLPSAYNFLGEGYQKKGNKEKAKKVWEKLIELAPDSKEAEEAKESLSSLGPPPSKGKQKRPEGGAIKRAKELMAKGRYEEAGEILLEAVEADSTDAQAEALLGLTYIQMAAMGYDERIAKDTNYRIGLCSQAFSHLDRAVWLAPEDLEIRLLRGITEANSPAFLGRGEQAIEDLKMVADGPVPDSTKAEALYYLGWVHKMKALSLWGEVTDKYPQSRTAQQIYDQMSPPQEPDLSPGPKVVISFWLGYQDQLPPQTAVWVEDSKGRFVRTLFVSGFAGWVGKRQVTLPQWGKASGFKADAATGASIDYGSVTFIWDLKDGSGKRAKKGKYIIKVEVQHWPSIHHSLASAQIEVGKKRKSTVVHQPPFIPILEVIYIPK